MEIIRVKSIFSGSFSAYLASVFVLISKAIRQVKTK